MVVKLLHDTIVRMKAGMVLDLPDEEAKRLISFNNAKVEKKKTEKKKGGK